MRELVMVIADVFLDPRGEEVAALARSAFTQIPGIERIGRFGERLTLTNWRDYVAALAGRADLAAVAPACIAGARLPGWQAPQRGACWIASPVHLSAGLTRVHLDHGGLLRLPAPELAELAAAFAATFGADGPTLTPLPCGELLLATPAVDGLPTMEPARLAGGTLNQVLPDSAAAAPLRRLMTECEMWLHGAQLNLTRARRGAIAVTALWPWGAMGSLSLPQSSAPAGLPAAFGSDAWLDGLWRLGGGQCRALPRELDEMLAPDGSGVVAVLRVAEELQQDGQDNAAAALARLDARFISPALRALAAGRLSAVTLLLNDHGVRVRRRHRLRLWRRPRAGITGFA